jgi:phospholipid/cholesterol/gamma-HCH transport system substrate-binding protein
METRAHYVAVGAFVLATLFLGFVAVLWLAGTQFATSYKHYDIFFKGPVTGLSKGARVDYNGIPVGQVSEVAIDPENVEQIRVTVEIKSEVVIKDDAAANVETNILSGVSYVLITKGTNDAKVLEAHKGQRYPVIRSRRSTFASLAARGPQLLEKLDVILDHLDDVLSDHNREMFTGILDNVRKATGNLADHSDEIASNATEALKSAASLFAAVNQAFSAPDGLKDRLSAALGQANTALGHANTTLGQVDTAFADADKLAKGLSDTNRQLDGALVDMRPGLKTFSQHTLANVDALVGEVRQFVAGLGRLASQLEHDPTRLLFGDRREGYQPK